MAAGIGLLVSENILPSIVNSTTLQSPLSWHKSLRGRYQQGFFCTFGSSHATLFSPAKETDRAQWFIDIDLVLRQAIS